MSTPNIKSRIFLTGQINQPGKEFFAFNPVNCFSKIIIHDEIEKSTTDSYHFTPGGIASHIL